MSTGYLYRGVRARTLLVVGSGPGLGLSMARTFGRQGFRVALVARTKRRLETEAAQLRDEGIEAAGFPADVTDPAGTAAAVAEAVKRFGRLDVVDYGVTPDFRDPATPFADTLGVTVANVRPHLDLHLNGLITVVHEVLPHLREHHGTILVTAGYSAIEPAPFMANVGPATAAMRHFTLNLHNVLRGEGVHAAFIAISGLIGIGPPESHPDRIAEFIWGIHGDGTAAEHVYRIPPSAQAQETLRALVAENAKD